MSNDMRAGRSSIQDALFDAVAFWELAPALGASEVIDTATEALVRGHDTPSLRQLAGASPKESYWVLRSLVEDTLGELGMVYPGPVHSDVQVAATRVMCRRLLNGQLEPRELVRWAHRTIGHEGAPRLQPLVELDDEYHEIDYRGRAVEDLDQETYAEARNLVDGQRAGCRDD